MKKSLRSFAIFSFLTILSTNSCFLDLGLYRLFLPQYKTTDNQDTNESTTPNNHNGDSSVGHNDNINKDDEKQENLFDETKYTLNDNISIPSTFSLNVNSKINLPCSITSNSNLDINSITWVSENPDIASIESNGLIQPKKRGETYIYATINSNYNKCKLSIYDETLDNISFDLDFIELTVNESKSLNPVLKVEDNNQIKEINNIQYISSNPDVVTITENSIKGIKVGESLITAFYDKNNNSINDSDEIQKNIVVGVSNEQISHSLSHYYYIDEEDVVKRRDIALAHFDEYEKVPFISIDDVVEIRNNEILISDINTSETNKGRYEVKDNLFYLYLPTHIQIILNPETNSITYLNFNSNMPVKNNNISGDICIEGEENSLIQGSEKTKILKKGTPHETMNLNDYNLKMFLVDDNLYLPFNLVSQLFYINPYLFSSNSTLFYNGNDICSLAEAEEFNLYSYFYSSDDSFMYKNGSKYSTFTKETTNNENLKYVYTYYDTTETPGQYNAGYMKFYKNNTGEFKEVSGINQKSLSAIEAKNSSSSYKFIYDESDLDKTIAVYKYNSTNPREIEKPFLIKKEKSFFNSTTFPTGYKDFNYNLLALYFDYFYGMKEFRNINSFYDVFENNKFTIKSTIYNDNQVTYNTSSTFKSFYDNINNIQDYNILMTSFVNKFLGHDCHSYPQFSSSIGKIQSTLFSNVRNITFSERNIAINDNGKSYKSLRKNKLSTSSPGMYSYDSTFIIQFDQFYTLNYPSDGKLSYKYYEDKSYSQIVSNDSFGALSKAFCEIEKNDKIKNVVIDLTCNPGGASTGVTYTQAFLTKDPTFTYNLGLENILAEFHYKVDLNGDGIYGGDDDTFEGKYNFFILTSEYSFSCANAVASSVKNNGCATIIGKQSSGGPCCLFHSCDAMGFYFYTSHPSTIMVKNSDDYEANDNGVIVDYELSSDYFYDYQKLNEYINTNIVPNL